MRYSTVSIPSPVEDRFSSNNHLYPLVFFPLSAVHSSFATMKYISAFKLPSTNTVKERCTSLDSWALPKEKSAIAPDYVRTNKDMDPVPKEDQTWSMWTWMAYWATDTINLGTWETASSIIAVGLTWRDAIPIMVVGTTCVAIPMVLNGA